MAQPEALDLLARATGVFLYHVLYGGHVARSLAAYRAMMVTLVASAEKLLPLLWRAAALPRGRDAASGPARAVLLATCHLYAAYNAAPKLEAASQQVQPVPLSGGASSRGGGEGVVPYLRATLTALVSELHGRDSGAAAASSAEVAW